MSFFDDDEPDEPTRVTRPARPRRAAPAGAGRAAAPPPPDIARRRQFVLFGGLALIALLLILFARSCAGTRHKNALKDYNRDVASIVQSSDDTASKQLFDILQGSGDTDNVTVAAQQVRITAEEDAKRAKALDAPDDVEAAQHDFELVMNLRAAAVREIADQLPRALSSQPSAAEAIRKVAGQMQAFLASDVVYSQRVAPLIKDALDDNDINQTVASSKFLPSIGWLDAAQVGDKLNPDADAGTGASAGGQPKPGTHGHGLVGTKAGGIQLQPGGVINRVTSKAPLPVEVTYANQGENDETNVTINVKISGGPKPISVNKRLNQTKAGTQAAVTINLQSVPPKGSSTTMTVTIKRVPGEQKTDNNTSTYTVLFN
ncbi:MAG TPA: hypothetical protein VNT03_13670 [Baekduia sp.]|nr:hypothetical protein [Baekduia sp.]